MYPGKWGIEYPDKPAAIDAVTGETVTYGELNERSNRLAQLLWARGLRRGGHIAIFMENNLRFFEVVWAAFRSGLYLTTVNRYLTAEEAGYIVDNCEAQAVIASGHLADVAADIPRYAPDCHSWLMVGGKLDGYEAYEDAIADFSAENLEEEPAGAFMLYSSGTTGRPKGIVRPLPEQTIHEDAGPLVSVLRMLWGFDESTVYLSPAPLYHSAPVGFSISVQAVAGTVVVMPRFDAVGVLKAIEEHRVTHSQWVPTMFSRMLKLPDEDRLGFDLSSHKVAIHAAAPCPQAVKRQMLDWWGPILYEYYAGTEFNGITHATPQDWLAHPGTVGKSLVGVIHICGEDGSELPAGEAGLIYFEMPRLPFEYYKDSAKTRSAQHPQHTNWTALGDVGYVDEEGFLYLTDRATFMIVSGGVNIYPQEIEDAMIMHDKVVDIAVVGVPDQEMGEAVKGVVQLADGIPASDEVAAELLAYTRDRIAHFKCPKSIDFIDEMPRLPTGKLYKRLIKDKYWGKSGSRIV